MWRVVLLNIGDTYVIHPVNTEYNSYCSQKYNKGHLFRETIDLYKKKEVPDSLL